MNDASDWPPAAPAVPAPASAAIATASAVIARLMLPPLSTSGYAAAHTISDDRVQFRARPQGLQGVRRTRPLSDRARRGGRPRDRPGLRGALRAAQDRRRARHAGLLPRHGR